MTLMNRRQFDANWAACIFFQSSFSIKTVFMTEPFIGSTVIFAGNFSPHGWAFYQGLNPLYCSKLRSSRHFRHWEAFSLPVVKILTEG